VGLPHPQRAAHVGVGGRVPYWSLGRLRAASGGSVDRLSGVQ
jgi:hypothetical protein